MNYQLTPGPPTVYTALERELTARSFADLLPLGVPKSYVSSAVARVLQRAGINDEFLRCWLRFQGHEWAGKPLEQRLQQWLSPLRIQVLIEVFEGWVYGPYTH